ncbi:MAG: aryl-sulfate sulfotransferase, partial [Candidatus Kapabacteria bacterium]|jgi:hypothetical protein|nr:aryl-sulfate sulfotransferase [Candidatus Kapabacteria bacterium]
MTTTELAALDPGGWLDAYVYVLDENLETIATYKAGNGMPAGGHEFVLMSNGHKLMLAFEPKYIDMSKYVENGDPNALVRTSIIQEFDADDRIIYQWRAWDHIPLLDNFADLSGRYIYHTLFNSMDFDGEGNILISNRLGSEIIKIDRNSGEIVWRLGGLNNDFEFIGEHESNAPNYFSFQHDIRWLPNGNITLFDNGFQHSPQYSRGVEYKLDQTDMTAELVWEFRNETNIFASANGSCRRLDNGNTLIGWGWVASQFKKDLVEVTPENNKVLEMGMPANVGSFRWVKSPFPLNQSTADVTRDELLNLNIYKFETAGLTLSFKELNNATPYNRVNVKKFEYGPKNARFNARPPYVAAYKYVIEQSGINSFNAELKFDLSVLPWVVNPEEWRVYNRSSLDTGYFNELPTVYNQESNELIVNTEDFGEFIFGIPAKEQLPLTPTLFLPENEEIVNQNSPLTLKWSPHGYFQECIVEIATDEEFDNVVFRDTLNPTLIEINDLVPESVHFWRVKSINEYGESDWSEIFTFISSAPYISISEPNGGEKWMKDAKRKIIRWNTNTDDAVKIELVRNGLVESVIADSIVSFTGANAWVIPAGIIPDSIYTVRITSLLNPELISESDETFTIEDDVNSVNEYNSLASGLSIRNYPNPFTNSTIFEFTNEISGNIVINLFDIKGVKVAEIFNDYAEKGTHSINWTNTKLESGSYFYEIKSANGSHSGKLIIGH